MKKTKLMLWVWVAVLLPGTVHAENRIYFGVAMLNSVYTNSRYNHRSAGLMGRLGYDFNKRFAVEGHFGGSIGPESNTNTNIGQAQMDSIYSAFLRLNTYIGEQRLYALAGMSYGTQVLRSSGAGMFHKNSDTNRSLGFGLEIFGNQDLSFDFQLIRYFDNRYYTVDAFNLGLVTRF